MKHLPSTLLVTLLLATGPALAVGPGWQPLGPEGGFVITLTPVPGVAGRLYATTPRSGLYRSNNGGYSWRGADLGIRHQEVRVVAVAASDPRVLYAGSFEAQNGYLWRSDDGGESWHELLPATVWPDLSALLVDPRDPDRLYAVAGDSVYRTSDGGLNWFPSFGQGATVAAVAIDPHQPDTVYAVTNESIYRSLDGGLGWQRVLGDSFVRDVVASPRQAGVVYAASSVHGLLVSSDSGTTWSQPGRMPPPLLGLVVDSGAAGTLLGRDELGVLRSTDGGATWQRVDLRAGTFTLAADPVLPGTFYAAGGDTLWRSTDGGASWFVQPRRGLHGLRTRHLTVTPAEPAPVLFTSPPQLWRSADEGQSWQVSLDDADIVVADPSAPDQLWAAGSAFVLRSGDGGISWETVGSPQEDPVLYCIEPAALVLGGQPGRLYLGGERSFPECRYGNPGVCGGARSDDAGETWSCLGDPAAFGPVSALLVLPGPPERLFAAFAAGPQPGIHQSIDGGDSWQLRFGFTSPISALVRDPHDPDTLLAGTFSSVRRSTDGGETWEKVGGDLPSVQVVGLAADPRVPGQWLAAAEGMGVYRSTDGGSSWQPFNDGLPAQHVIGDVRIDEAGRHAYVATGQGVFRRRLLGCRERPGACAAAGGTRVQRGSDF